MFLSAIPFSAIMVQMWCENFTKYMDLQCFLKCCDNGMLQHRGGMETILLFIVIVQKLFGFCFLKPFAREAQC